VAAAAAVGGLLWEGLAWELPDMRQQGIHLIGGKIRGVGFTTRVVLLTVLPEVFDIDGRLTSLAY